MTPSLMQPRFLRIKLYIFEDIKIVKDWFTANNVHVRIRHVSNFYSNYNIVCPYKVLFLSPSHLAVKLDSSSVGWKVHIADLQIKLNKAFFFKILTLSKVIDVNTLKMVYYAYFYLDLIYCIKLWGNATDMNEVFQIKKKVIRVITKAPPKTSCRGLFKTLTILSGASVYIYLDF